MKKGPSHLTDLKIRWRPQGDFLRQAQDKFTPDIPLGKRDGLDPKQKEVTEKSITPFKKWRPQGDLNPCCRRERPVSWTWLDDGDEKLSFVVGRVGLEPTTLCLKGRYSSN